MPTVTLTYPTGVTQRIVDAFVNVYGYQAQIPDPANPGQTIANPETPAAFVKRKLGEHIKDVVKTYEATTAQQAAQQAAVAKVDTDVAIT